MSIVGWLILGLIAGLLFSLLGAAPVTGLNIYGMIVAVIGAIVVLVIHRTVIGRRTI
jgi:uncharacterized membrane protein YeaQ/YmgE (transglycosylase-associated protein family)